MTKIKTGQAVRIEGATRENNPNLFLFEGLSGELCNHKDEDEGKWVIWLGKWDGMQEQIVVDEPWLEKYAVEIPLSPFDVRERWLDQALSSGDNQYAIDVFDLVNKAYECGKRDGTQITNQGFERMMKFVEDEIGFEYWAATLTVLDLLKVAGVNLTKIPNEETL